MCRHDFANLRPRKSLLRLIDLGLLAGGDAHALPDCRARRVAFRCAGSRRAAAGERSCLDRGHAQLARRLPHPPHAQGRARRHAGLEPAGRLRAAGTRRRLCRLPRRRARRQSRPNRVAGFANAEDGQPRPLGGGARRRLFRVAALEADAAPDRAQRTALRRAEREISRRQDGDARAVRYPAERDHARARAQTPASRRGVRQAAAPPDPAAEPGSARHPVGLLFRHRQLRADHAHHRHAAAVAGSRRRRPADRRRHGQVQPRQQRHARSPPARHAEELAQGARPAESDRAPPRRRDRRRRDRRYRAHPQGGAGSDRGAAQQRPGL
jgi:hypothetical protein